MEHRAIRVMLGLSTAILVVTALYFARAILAPVVFALFVIAIVWPITRRLSKHVPQFVALATTVLVTVAALLVLALMMAWGFGKAGQWLIGSASRFQDRYAHMSAWLEGHGILVTALLVENFSVGWIIRLVQYAAAQLHGLLSFAVIAATFVILGLLEVEVLQNSIRTSMSPVTGSDLLQTGARIADKLQRYMLVRTLMSVVTGVVVWLFVLVAGLELATAWGVIAFVLNYIPFIGPLVATVFPALFALAQYESWQMPLVVFLILNAIQFVLGSYLEPRIAGSALSVSPFMVLFAVFFWAFLWGIPGAFLGVPALIVFVTICEQNGSTRWVASLLSGRRSG